MSSARRTREHSHTMATKLRITQRRRLMAFGWFLPVVISVICFGTSFGRNASFAQESHGDGLVFRQVDAAQMLLEQTREQLRPTNTSRYRCKCEKRYSKIWGLLGAKIRTATRCHAQCVGGLELTNLVVEETKSIVEYPNIEKIPITREEWQIDQKNCSSSEQVWEENLTVVSRRSLQSTATKTFSKVTNREFKVALDAEWLKKAGLGSIEGTVSDSVEISNVSGESRTVVEETTLVKPIKVTVPARTRRKTLYSEGRVRIKFPVRVEMVLDGDVQEQHFVYDTNRNIVTGEIAHADHWSPAGVTGKLSNYVPSKRLRTVTLDAVLAVEGGDRKIEVRYLEEKLDPAECEIRQDGTAAGN